MVGEFKGDLLGWSEDHNWASQGMSIFLPRVIDVISAIDRLNEAGLLVYHDDNQIYLQPVKARSFYQYLHQLHEMLRADLGNY